MKKAIFATIAIMGVTMFTFSSQSTAAGPNAMQYECWTYVNSKPDKMVHVVADNSSEAVSLAEVKFKDLGAKWDYIKCK